MKIFCFSDVHGSKAAFERIYAIVKEQKPDAAICAGDLTVWGEKLDKLIKYLAALPLPVFIVHGNHESEEAMEAACAKYKNVAFVHKQMVRKGPLAVFGWGGGGFSAVDKEFDTFVKKHEQKLKAIPALIFVTHGPPYGTKLDELNGDHTGSKSYSKFIKDFANVKLAVSGHLHENNGVQDKLGEAILINAGPHGYVINLNIK